MLERLDHLPRVADAEKWAEHLGYVERHWTLPSTALGRRKWRLSIRPFAAESRRIRALLVPLGTQGFVVSVNTAVVTTSAEREWVIAHELAHSLFFAANGRRTLPWSADEERFCDSVADRWCGALVDVDG